MKQKLIIGLVFVLCALGAGVSMNYLLDHKAEHARIAAFLSVQPMRVRGI